VRRRRMRKKWIKQLKAWTTLNNQRMLTPRKRKRDKKAKKGGIVVLRVKNTHRLSGKPRREKKKWSWETNAPKEKRKGGGVPSNQVQKKSTLERKEKGIVARVESGKMWQEVNSKTHVFWQKERGQVQKWSRESIPHIGVRGKSVGQKVVKPLGRSKEKRTVRRAGNKESKTHPRANAKKKKRGIQKKSQMGDAVCRCEKKKENKRKSLLL